MKVVILAGGFGTRLSEETEVRPKPMVEIGDYPILWHIMKIYSFYGHNDFVICLGYKGYIIKEYFANYFLHKSDVTINLKNNELHYENTKSEPWSLTLVDTGLKTNTGGRIKRVRRYLNDETFMLTYGDGVADIDIRSLVEFHRSQNKIATISAVRPEGRFGSLSVNRDNAVTSFIEKPPGDNSWVNGGFFVLEQDIFDFIQDDSTIWEGEPLQNIARIDSLSAYKHDGFWKPMDTLRDRVHLNELWATGKAPWKVWNE